MVGARSKKDLVAALNRPAKGNRIPKLEGKEAELMTGVFARMKSIYGHLWSSNFADGDQLTIAKLDWLGAIRREGFTLGEVNAALDWCASKEDNMPNLPKFIAISRQVRSRLQIEREAAGRPPALPMTEGQREEIKAQMAAERAAEIERSRPHLEKLQALFK